jgi:hypothetical protein
MTSTNHLRPVADDEKLPASSGLPDFEGQPVMSTRLRLTSVSGLEVDDDVSHIDEIVKMYIEGRVVRVDHVVEEKTGFLLRVHTVKVLDAIQLPWGFDTGVMND